MLSGLQEVNHTSPPDQSTATDRYCPHCRVATAQMVCNSDGTATLLQHRPASETYNFKVGHVLANRYRLQKMLGRGGFGAVYAGEALSTGQRVAIKVLLLQEGDEQSSSEAARRFFQEAKITSQLQHPNTVRLFDFGQAEDGALFMALELINGPTLDQKLRELKELATAMTQEAALDLANAVLGSLAEAHAVGLVHRDLKPQNLMYAEMPGGDSVVKVLDFGIARTHDSTMTGQGSLLGTPAYMSPEQCRGVAVDGRSDLYALGLVLFRCVTGRLPFENDNPMSLIFMRLTESVPDPRSLSKVPISDGFAELILRSLAVEPQDRFADAPAMRAAVLALRSEAKPSRTADWLWAETATAPLGPVRKPAPASTPVPTQVPGTVSISQKPKLSKRQVASLAVAGIALAFGVVAVLPPGREPAATEPAAVTAGSSPKVAAVLGPVSEPAPAAALPNALPLAASPTTDPVVPAAEQQLPVAAPKAVLPPPAELRRLAPGRNSATKQRPVAPQPSKALPSVKDYLPPP